MAEVRLTIQLPVSLVACGRVLQALDEAFPGAVLDFNTQQVVFQVNIDDDDDGEEQ